MSGMTIELYEALRSVGVEEGMAKAAARAVLASDARTDLATKADIADLRTAMAELKSDLTWRIVGTLIAVTAIYGGLVATLKLFG